MLNQDESRLVQTLYKYKKDQKGQKKQTQRQFTFGHLSLAAVWVLLILRFQWNLELISCGSCPPQLMPALAWVLARCNDFRSSSALQSNYQVLNPVVGSSQAGDYMLCGSNVAAKILPWGVIRPQNPSCGSSTVDKRKVRVLMPRVAGDEFSRYSGRSCLIWLAKHFCSLSDVPLTLHFVGPDGTLMCSMSLLPFSVSRSDKCGTDLQERSRDALKVLLLDHLFTSEHLYHSVPQAFLLVLYRKMQGWPNRMESSTQDHITTWYYLHLFATAYRGQLLFTWILSIRNLLNIQPPTGIWQHTDTHMYTYAHRWVILIAIICPGFLGHAESRNIKRQQFKHRIKSV